MRLEIVILNGPLSGKRFAVPANGLRLGRSSSNDIHIPDAELSRNHCFFEAAGDGGVRLTDLASANGTSVNGKSLGDKSADLKPGDVIEVGETRLMAVKEGEKAVLDDANTIDLGLGGGNARLASAASSRVCAGGVRSGAGAARNGAGGASSAGRRSPFSWLLWTVALAAVGAAAYLFLLARPADDAANVKSVEEAEATPVLKEFYYEKVEADSDAIFRYELKLAADGVLSVAVDDVPGENRHVAKSQKLDDAALAELNDILAFEAIRPIDREYVGVAPEPPELDSWSLKVVYSNRARTVKVVNTQEPEAFRAIRERLETFSKNQLGVWALQYSRDKLVELAQAAIEQAQAKWGDRDVQHGNLFGAVKAFEEALFYLETVNPKPDCAAEARQGLKLAKEELEKRYKEQNFLVDRAINLQQWENAQRELGVLLEMIPDRADARNREASAKLLDVEKRLKGGK